MAFFPTRVRRHEGSMIRLSPRSRSGLFAAILLGFSASTSLLGAADVAVTLELGQQVFYAGDALKARISVHNTSDKKVSNPVHGSLFSGFRARVAGGAALEATSGGAPAEEPARPEKLVADSFYGAVLDLAGLYPGLRAAGSYEIYWSADDLASNMLVVT